MTWYEKVFEIALTVLKKSAIRHVLPDSFVILSSYITVLSFFSEDFQI